MNILDPYRNENTLRIWITKHLYIRWTIVIVNIKVKVHRKIKVKRKVKVCKQIRVYEKVKVYKNGSDLIRNVKLKVH